MDDALAGGEPLDVAAPEPGRGTERVGVIDQPSPYDRHGLEPAVWMPRKSRDGVAVIHAPAVLAGEVLTDVTPCERRRGSHLLVTSRVRVVVIDAEQERVERLPRHAQGKDAQDGFAHGCHR